MARTTIEDVAREAGVSVATVSRALRDLPNVAPATRSRIRSIAAGLDYAPHAQASRLASGRTMTVGLVAPLFGLWYASQVMAGAESVLADSGYDLLIHGVETPGNRDRFLARLGSLRGTVDGMLFVDFFATDKQAERLRSLAMPAVTVGERIEGLSSITIDNYGASLGGVRHLIELGHRRIALMTGPSPAVARSPVPIIRANGYRAALAERAIPCDQALEVDGEFTVEGGAAAMARLMALAAPPTAVFCLSDEMAIGAMGAARRAGWGVPEDISVLGFDGHDLAPAVGLTTLEQPVRSMGSTATRRLVDAIARAEPEPTHGSADVRLAVRGSTGRPRTR